MADTKNICILGSTGSIGKNSLEVIARFPGRFRVSCLTANKNTELLAEQIERFHPDAVALLDPRAAEKLKRSYRGSTEIFAGDTGCTQIVTKPDVDIVISSLVGFAGLHPTIEAIKLGKTVALANKEVLVAAGAVITRLVREHHATLLPIDSEHNAVLQCLAGENRRSIARLILTASGGPFLYLDKNEFSSVTVDAALKPTGSLICRRRRSASLFIPSRLFIRWWSLSMAR